MVLGLRKKNEIECTQGQLFPFLFNFIRGKVELATLVDSLLALGI